MKYKSTVFCHQFPIMKTFLQHAVYYRVTFAAYNTMQIKDEYWTATINAHYLQAILDWCMVFGADGCNSTHWKNLSITDTTNIQYAQELDATVWRIWVPPEADLKKQGKLGSDVGAPTVAQYLCMRKVG